MKLFLILLGAETPGRNVEQHDYFFAIADTIKELVPEIKAFWPDAGKGLHIDGWREVNKVDDCSVSVVPLMDDTPVSAKKLFFLNLGGYTKDKLEEQHYTVLTAQEDQAKAIRMAKHSVFFKTNTFKGATSHIDEKFGIDVDDIYQVEELLSPASKEKYRILITEGTNLPDDEIHLGYFKLDKLK